jgi:tripeptidyl-peptidase-1
MYAADELLAALDGSYCSVSPVDSEGQPETAIHVIINHNEISLGITDCGNKLRTSVISISYHFNPDLTDPSISPVVQRQCTEIGKV